MEQFIKYAEEKGVPRDNKGLKESGIVINTQVKAYIARNIIGEEGIGLWTIDQEIGKLDQAAHGGETGGN